MVKYHSETGASSQTDTRCQPPPPPSYKDRSMNLSPFPSKCGNMWGRKRFLAGVRMLTQIFVDLHVECQTFLKYRNQRSCSLPHPFQRSKVVRTDLSPLFFFLQKKSQVVDLLGRRQRYRSKVEGRHFAHFCMLKLPPLIEMTPKRYRTGTLQ